MKRPGSKRIVGLALLASSLVLVSLGAAFWADLIETASHGRSLLAASLCGAGIVDALVGVTFVLISE